jgi:ABC-type spermidine/putrescine transport system permease subunit II
MSAILGVLAAAADSDEVGRQQLMGLAMAYPFVKFPVWIGISLVLGFPDAATTRARLASLAGDVLIMTAMAALTYLVMARRGELERLPD